MLRSPYGRTTRSSGFRRRRSRFRRTRHELRTPSGQDEITDGQEARSRGLDPVLREVPIGRCHVARSGRLERTSDGDGPLSSGVPGKARLATPRSSLVRADGTAPAPGGWITRSWDHTFTSRGRAALRPGPRRLQRCPTRPRKSWSRSTSARHLALSARLAVGHQGGR